jgi:hypothetical protein
MFNSEVVRAKTVQPEANLEHPHLMLRNSSLQKYQSVNTILTNYVQGKHQQSQMTMILLQKMKRDHVDQERTLQDAMGWK